MRVPEYDSPQVAPQALPDVRAQTIANPGGTQALGQGLEQLGAGTERLADDVLRVQRIAEHKAAATWAANAATQLRHDTDTGLYGNQAGTDPNAGLAGPASPSSGPSPTDSDAVGHSTPSGPSQAAKDASQDPESGLSPKGILNEQGMAAAKYGHGTMQWVAGRAQDIASQAPNDEAKEMFQRIAATHIEETRAQIERHASEQRREAEESALKGTTAMALKSIATNYADPDRIERELSGLEPMVRSLSLSTPAADAQIAAIREKAYSTVLNQFIADKDWKSAQATFAAHKSDLGEQAAQFEHTIGHLRAQQEGDDLASGVLKGAHITGSVSPDGAAAGDSGMVDTGKAIRDWEALPKEKRTPEAEEAFSKHLRLADEGNRATASKTFTDAMGSWIQNHSLSDVDPHLASWMKDNDPEGWHKLEQMDQQWKTEHARAPRAAKTEPSNEQYAAFWHWMDKPDAEVKDISHEQLDRDMRGVMPDKLLEKMHSRLFAISGKPQKTDTTLAQPLRDVILSQVKEHYPQAKGDLFKDPGEAGRVATAIEERVLKEDTAERAQHKGIGLKMDDVRRIAAEELVQYKVTTDKGIIYDSHKVIPQAEYENNPAYRGKEIVPEDKAPDDFAETVRARFKAAGLGEPGDDVIQKAYQGHLRELNPEQFEPKPESAPSPAPKSTRTASAAPAPAAPKVDLTHPVNRQVLVSAGLIKGKPSPPDKPSSPDKPNKPSKGAEKPFDPNSLLDIITLNKEQ